MSEGMKNRLTKDEEIVEEPAPLEKTPVEEVVPEEVKETPVEEPVEEVK